MKWVGLNANGTNMIKIWIPRKHFTGKEDVTHKTTLKLPICKQNKCEKGTPAEEVFQKWWNVIDQFPLVPIFVVFIERVRIPELRLVGKS